MTVSCLPVIGNVRDCVEVITGVDMITGEKLSVLERLIAAVCLFIPVVGASFVRESGQGIVKFIGKHWDEAMQFASKYIDEGITLLSKHGGDFLMNIAKKGDDLSTLLKRAFNFGDEIEFAGVGTLKGDPEVSTKLQDFVSKITGKVDNVSSGTVKGMTEVANLWRKSKCSNDELYNYLLKNVNEDVANKFLKEGKWPDGIQIPKNSSVVNPDGSINWSKAAEGGYTLRADGTAIKHEFKPQIGEIIDRYGNANGRYTSPIIDGKPYSYTERSLPYVEDLSNYHQYEVVGDFNKLEEYVKNCKDVNVKNDVEDIINLYFSGDYNKVIAYKGEIAGIKGWGTGGGIHHSN